HELFMATIFYSSYQFSASGTLHGDLFLLWFSFFGFMNSSWRPLSSLVLVFRLHELFMATIFYSSYQF
ncbi:hypothetical protein, partial [Cytobacillus sp. Bac17]|uniref:hypothetical protein n=1 Tax=Cytobacillus sp. Bac17 TaxID=2926008 RepID=UPI00211986EC